MPIQLDIFHPNRIVVVVARGTITADEVVAAIEDFVAHGAYHYRKIIDATMANVSIDGGRVQQIIQHLRDHTREVPRGPLAFVVDPARNPWIPKFAEATAGERPVGVFRSIHEARRWLDQVSVTLPNR